MDKLISRVSSTRKGMWASFKKGIDVPGYHYYEAPKELKYRYPAPGSQPFYEEDHFNLYKEDWKTPFRMSEFNIQKIESTLDDEDPRSNMTYHNPRPPKLDPTGKRGHYDAQIMEV